MKKRILVLGAGYAGIMAVNRLAKIDKHLDITLINERDEFVERIRNHEKLNPRPYKKYKITDLIPNNVNFVEDKISNWNPDSSTIQLTNDKSEWKYDGLIYALGSTKTNTMNPWLGIQTLTQTMETSQVLSEKQIQSVWILGGGLTGIELATELKESNKEISVGIIEQGKFAHQFSKKGQTYIRNFFQKNHIQIIEGAKLIEHQNNEITFGNGTKVSYDLLIKTTGFLCSDLAKEAGIDTNEKNQIYVNEYLQIPKYQNVFVAGDAVYLPGSALRMGCVTAMPMGVYAAETVMKSLNGKKVYPFKFGFAGRCVSLGRKNGLIQMTNAYDKPKDLIFTGKLGAIIKELVCKYTMLSIKLEKSLPIRSYFWPKQDLMKIEKEI
ncbi:MAG: FAD-dependent oxidoreductase [Leptospira sp.]|nr:FAD-dependent oxidoreductase [Leptospira sp.]